MTTNTRHESALEIARRDAALNRLPRPPEPEPVAPPATEPWEPWRKIPRRFRALRKALGEPPRKRTRKSKAEKRQ